MEERPSTAQLALKWGLISGVASILYTTVIYLTGQFTNSSLNWLSIIFPITFIVLAMRDYRTLNGGFMTYGEGVSLGTLTAVVAGLLSMIYNFVYTTFIDSTIQDQIKDQLRAQYEERGLSDEQIDQALAMTEKIQTPGITFFLGVLGAGLTGLIISLIVAAFMRRNKPFADFPE